MKESELVSIIIPVYNVEKYLSKCLDSVINQTYYNLEIILVDDGSTDSSGKICDEYMHSDKRVKVVHQKNGGLSNARNTGLNIFDGKYVTFIDSDDFVEQTYIERLYQIIQKSEADIAVVSFELFYEFQKIQTVKVDALEVKEYSNIEAIADMWYQKNINTSAWAKLYERKLFSDIRYPDGMIYEDLGTTYKLFFASNKVAYSSEKLYYYLQRRDSIMQYKFSVKKIDRIVISQEILDWVNENCLELIPAAETRFFTSNIQVLREIPLNEQYKSELKKIKRNIKEYRIKVMRNKDAKKITRLIAFCSVIDIRWLKYLGSLYKKIYG